MLYVTTRNEHDAYTAHRAIHSLKGTDGGDFLPFRMPALTQEEIAALKDISFGQCVADMLAISREYDARWYCAGPLSKKGHPHHPLYLRKDELLKPFDTQNYLQSQMAGV